MQTNILAPLSSHLTATGKSGGSVTNVQMATCTAGLLLLLAEALAGGCPQCSGRSVCKHNFLATKNPLVATEWHPTSNAFSPEDVTATSHKSAVWQCQACSHVWTARIADRVARGSGCPACSRRIQARPRKRRPTLADSKSPLLREWDPSRKHVLQKAR